MSRLIWILLPEGGNQRKVSFLNETLSYAKVCDGVRYDPKAHDGVKIDHYVLLSMIFGPAIRVNRILIKV